MPVRRAFIYGLWGSSDLSPRRAKTLTEVERWTRDKHRPKPFRVYCFGVGNHDWLASRGIKSTMLDSRPLVDFYGVGGPPNPKGKGQLVWGDCSIWRHKTGIMAAAMREHDEIVWLDWDTILSRPLPEDFWARMRQGQSIQMSLVQYHRIHCYWRPKRFGRRTVPEGAFIYLRDRRIIARVNRRYARHRGLVDQTIFASVMDEMMGGWKGHDEYKRLGFEPYCHSIYCQFHEPDDALFRTGGRITLETWERKYARRDGQATSNSPTS